MSIRRAGNIYCKGNNMVGSGYLKIRMIEELCSA